MRAAHPEQQQRLYAKLCREFGAATLTALGDPDVTEVRCNPDGALWVESHAQGMRDLGDRLSESQVESLIGTVAALLGTVVHGRAPIVGEVRGGPRPGSRCGIAPATKRCDAVHSAAVHGALSGQGLGGIVFPVFGRSVHTASVLVEHDDVEVDLVPGVVA